MGFETNHPSEADKIAGPHDGRERTPAVVNLRMSRWVLVGLGLLLLVPWLVAGWLVIRLMPLVGTPKKSVVAARTVLSEKTHRSTPGPWGELEITRVTIEPPEDFVEMDFANRPPVRWLFAGRSVDQLRELWTVAGLTADQQRALLQTVQIDPQGKGLWITPSKELILELSTEARARLYTVLAASEENRMQANPYRFRAERAEEWFANSDVPERVIAVVKRLSYRRGPLLLFSDLDTVLPLLTTDAQRLELVKTLARSSIVLVKLRVQPETEIRSIIKYWSKAGRAKDIEPLLHSIPRIPGGFALDIAHLLPPVERKLVYTYPFPSDDPVSQRRDCHWTTMNFFNVEPDDQFTSPEHVKKTLESKYFIVSGKPVYGDRLFLIHPNGSVMHSCVYIADDIVFTKNGPQAYIPWKLMELPDVLAMYGDDKPLDIRIYRSRAD